MAVKKVRKGAWVLWDCPSYAISGAPARVIQFLLIERQDSVYGVKSMTAETYPYYYDCPAEWLNIEGVNFDADWADGVRYYRRHSGRERHGEGGGRRLIITSLGYS